jgi:nif11-class peptide radical SAM maturase 3
MSQIDTEIPPDPEILRRLEPTRVVRQSYAVWEITLKCNLACSHCGSRAGDARTEELSTAEALDLVHQLAEVGITEVTLIGGEAFLRKDWLDIAAEIVKSGMVCTMTTGGYGLSLAVAHRMKAAGIAAVAVSVDGLEEVHDALRGKKGAFTSAFRTMAHLTAAGIPIQANTQINRRSIPELPALYERLRDAGIRAWQIQLTVPMGNAADNHQILMQPAELVDVFPVLGYLCDRARGEGVRISAGNNIGYYGPYERLLRGYFLEDTAWNGCQAGINTLGIEADGSIKGCPSLPTGPYTGANIRDVKLSTIVHETAPLKFNENQGTPEGTDHLWGFCKGCRFAALCRGGCSWTAHVFFDKRGNNPYCHHRALTHAASGLRERVVPDRPAPGTPFDNGTFALVEEPIDAPWPEDDPLAFRLEHVRWPEAWLAAEPDLVERLRGERARAIAATPALPPSV